ncbi:MAG: hypothetical protein ACRDY6_20765 [Acidimicrobiia bacterium]
MVGVVGWDEGPFPAPVDESPSVPGLQVVVVTTEAVEEVEDGALRLGPVVAVVELQERERVAALGGAGGVEPFEGAALVGRRTPPEVGDADDVLALVTTAARNGSPVSIRSRTAETATGP